MTMAAPNNSQLTNGIGAQLDVRIGFIGAGQMAQALCKGFISSGLVDVSNIIASCPAQDVPENIYGVRTTTNNSEVVTASEIVIVAVKPHIVETVLREVSPAVTKKHLFVSVAAGITIAEMEEWLPADTRLVRVMPNTPAMVQCGVSVCSPGPHASPQDVSLVLKLFASVGIAESLPERLLEAVTGLSGSGPAYMYMAIEALADGGVKMGLPRVMAQRFAAQMVMGSAKMVLETGRHPGDLKDAVCSPGGTTIAAVHRLEKAGFRCALMDAVEASAVRSRELGSKK